jgi:hypothetical protein
VQDSLITTVVIYENLQLKQSQHCIINITWMDSNIKKKSWTNLVWIRNLKAESYHIKMMLFMLLKLKIVILLSIKKNSQFDRQKFGVQNTGFYSSSNFFSYLDFKPSWIIKLFAFI